MLYVRCSAVVAALAVTMATMLDTQLFLQPHRVPDREHGNSGTYGNQGGTLTPGVWLTCGVI